MTEEELKPPERETASDKALLPGDEVVIPGEEGQGWFFDHMTDAGYARVIRRDPDDPSRVETRPPVPMTEISRPELVVTPAEAGSSSPAPVSQEAAAAANRIQAPLTLDPESTTTAEASASVPPETIQVLQQKLDDLTDQVKTLLEELREKDASDGGGADGSTPEFHYRWAKKPKIGDQIYVKNGEVFEGDWSIDKFLEKDEVRLKKSYESVTRVMTLDQLAESDYEGAVVNERATKAEKVDGPRPSPEKLAELTVGKQVKVFSHRLKFETGTITESFTTEDLPEEKRKFYDEGKIYFKVRLGEGDDAIDRIVDEEVLRAWQADDIIERKSPPKDEAESRERFKEIFSSSKQKIEALKSKLDSVGSSSWAITESSTRPPPKSDETDKDKSKDIDKTQEKNKWRKRLFAPIIGAWTTTRNWGAPSPEEIKGPVLPSEPTESPTDSAPEPSTKPEDIEAIKAVEEKLASAGLNIGGTLTQRDTGNKFIIREVFRPGFGTSPELSVRLEQEDGERRVILDPDALISRVLEENGAWQRPPTT